MTGRTTAGVVAVAGLGLAAAAYLTGRPAAPVPVAPVPIAAPGRVEAPDPAWQRQIDALAAELAGLRRELEARPPAAGPGHDPDRHEQRIGALEFWRSGGK